MQSEIDFFTVLSNSDIGVIVLDPEMRVLFVNKKINHIYNTEENSPFVLGSRLTQIIQIGMQENKNIYAFPLQENIDNRSFHLLLYVYPQRNQDEITSVVVLACEATSLLNTFNNRLHQDKWLTIGNMAAGTANAILNPIAVIRGVTQLIEKQIAADYLEGNSPASPLNKHEQYFSLIYEHVKTIENLIHRFLLAGKPTNIKLTVVPIHSLVQKIIPKLQLIAMERHVSLQFEFPSRYSQVLAEERVLEEIVTALCLNALEAVTEDGVVKIGIHVSEETVQIMVSDNGPGIPREQIHRVRDPFYTTKEDALGFGLSYCEMMLQKLGGTLDIQSLAEGTQAIIKLPTTEINR